jgi:phospholipase/carboxylesterase
MDSNAYIHKALPGSPSGPLLFTFHGTGADENQLLSLGRDLVADAAIVSPRGDVSEHGAARFFRRTGEGVYNMADLERATDKMAGFVRAHVEALKPPRVLGLGYSNGANILASVIFAEPSLFDAAVLMHPLIPFVPQVNGSLAGRRILITAGRRDPICPPDLTDRLAGDLRGAQADVTVEWHQGGHEVRPNELDAARLFLAAPRQGDQGMTSELPQIELEDQGSKGRYVLRGPDGAEAEMTFTKVGEHKIIIDHTLVPDVFRGQGAGLRLVTRAVEDARASGKKIIPLCPFAAAQFQRHKEWSDVLTR